MRSIYKIVDKDLNERLKKEIDNVNKYMEDCFNKAKELIPNIENIAIKKHPITGDHTIVGLIIEKDVDTKLFKCIDDKVKIYVPKRNTKKGKELNKKLDFVGKSVKLFDEDKYEEELGYNPEQREIFERGMLTVNYLRFGFAEKDGDIVFVFAGYDGYKPTDKAKEITASEYNEIFNR